MNSEPDAELDAELEAEREAELEAELEAEEHRRDDVPGPLGNLTLQRKRTPGMMLGAAMLGLREVIYGKVKEDAVIEIESSGDPPNIDLDGLDEPLDDEHRMVAPPMDSLKARGRGTRRKARRPR